MDLEQKIDNEYFINIVTKESREINYIASKFIDEIRLDSSFSVNMINSLIDYYSNTVNDFSKFWFKLWKEHCDVFLNMHIIDGELSKYISKNVNEGLKYFICQTYANIIVEAIMKMFIKTNMESDIEFNRIGLLEWHNIEKNHNIGNIVKSIEKKIKSLNIFDRISNPVVLSNFLSIFYQEFFPPSIRNLSGEYYTPDWLVDYCLSQLSVNEISNDEEILSLDPSCGSGTFLVHFANKLIYEYGVSNINLIGFDINPLAVSISEKLMAIFNEWTSKNNNINFKYDIYLTDTIVDPWLTISDNSSDFGDNTQIGIRILGENIFYSDINNIDDKLRNLNILNDKYKVDIYSLFKKYINERFISIKHLNVKYAFGNPPWISWSDLKDSYREEIKKQWANSPLATLKGWYAKVASGKTDISSLFVYKCADIYTSHNAEMVFVLPISLFQSRRASEGFRTFVTKSRRKYPLKQLDDFSSLSIFSDAVNRSSVGLFKINDNLKYPINCRVWFMANKNGLLKSKLKQARPIDVKDSKSPLVIIDAEELGLLNIVNQSDYRARGGVNTGGANTIFWIDVIKQDDEGKLLISNISKNRKKINNQHEGVTEKDFVYPLIKGSDVKRWHVKNNKHILLCYTADDPKNAIDELTIKKLYPNTYEFLCKFKAQLINRREYHRWGAKGPFYEVYRIGPYTFSPIKVVWQHTGFRGKLRSAVIDDRGKNISIPDQKVIFIAVDDIREAHYICAYLNSSIIGQLLSKYLGVDASTHILNYIGLKKFDNYNPMHQKLADLSMQAHFAAEKQIDTHCIEKEIDETVIEHLKLIYPTPYNYWPSC